MKLVYAHRGVHGGDRRAENGMKAFRNAAGAGLGIETDLRTDAAGRIVLFHDRTISGVPIEAIEHAELERLAAREVVTLDALLSERLECPLNLEVKTRAAAAALVRYGGRLPPDTLLSSFVHDLSIDLSRSLGLPGALLLASVPTADAMPRAGEDVRTLVWDFGVVDASVLAAAADLGFEQFAYGAVTEQEHGFLFDRGCRGLITDHPERARAAAAGR